MTYAAAFSPDYLAARARFRAGALAIGAHLEALPLPTAGPDGEPLTVDVAVVGDRQPTHAVVVSGGLHGIEGFLGSAVQAVLLEELLAGFQPPAGVGVFLLHALNPFGFANLRRVNEENVDLNRNFLLPGERFEGSPPGYAELDPFLNPERPLKWSHEGFRGQAVSIIARKGFASLKDAVAGGQYDFPQGLFFGGARPQATQQILAAHLPRWFARAGRVLHVDFHTGLGKWGTYKLFIDREDGDPIAAELSDRFGPKVVEPWRQDGTAYTIRGGMGKWLQALHAPRCAYDVLTAEFGTADPLAVVRALHRENRAHHHNHPTDPLVEEAKLHLRDTFAPRDVRWRASCAAQGVTIAQTAIEAIVAAAEPR